MGKKEMGRATAIRKFFNTEGYPPLTMKEIKDFKVNNLKGFNEVGDDCVEYFGCVVHKE